MAEYSATLRARSGGQTGFDIEIRDFSLVGDGLAESGADGQGPTPFEYLATALGTCAGLTIRSYAQKHNIPLENVAIGVVHQRKPSGHGSDAEHHIRTEIALRGPLTDEQRQALLRAAESCPVRQFYQTIPRIEEVLVDELSSGPARSDEVTAAD